MATQGRRLIGAAVSAVLYLSLLSSCFTPRAQAAAARFDLTGPKIEVRVTRSGKTLPIASVPNLQPGDRLWIHPDLPPTQSVHYLLIVSFLRGTTNPPPDKWFTRIETWDKKVKEGIYVTVPKEAQQAILFLAPETGGDFSTLRSAVKGRPGVFVRASQDLAEAGFEQQRIERYISAMKTVPPGDPKALLKHSNLLARTLNLKPNEDCFKQPVDMQSTCLTQTGNQSLLDDGHGQTVVDALSNGPGSDFINAASYTQMAGGGVYSAYVGAVVDLVRLTSTLHTAQYQYIPAIAFPDRENLNLRLNTPPSFHNPKSVIVIGLPSIQSAVPPPLRPSDPRHVTCMLKSPIVLPVEGAPLVFSTAFAHDLVLHIEGTSTKEDLPLVADPFQGGLVVSHARPERRALPGDPEALPPASEATETSAKPKPELAGSRSPMVTGTITGYWGFDPFKGPTLQLQRAPGQDWKIAVDATLIAGRENHLTLSSTGSACVQSITLDNSAGGEQVPTKWKPADKPNLIDVSLTLKSSDPGAIHLAVKQYGEAKPDLVTAHSFSAPAELSAFVLHAGDTFAVLNGTSLNEVKQLTVGKLVFTPAPTPTTSASTSSIRMSLPGGAPAPGFTPGQKQIASVTLKDGRDLTLPFTVADPRPSVTLLSKSIGKPNSDIQLANPDDLPVSQSITFSLHSEQPFHRDSKIEVANSDESIHTMLSVADGSLVMQNQHTLLATLDPLKTFGTSTFGPLRLRPISPKGIAGDWLPLATLVRLPILRDLHCYSDPTKPCTLSGSALYLVDALSPDPNFTDPATVPEGFVGDSITMPHPVGGATFYLRLRDDPSSANAVTMPILPLKNPTTANAKTRSTTPSPPSPADTPDVTPDNSAPQAASPSTASEPVSKPSPSNPPPPVTSTQDTPKPGTPSTSSPQSQPSAPSAPPTAKDSTSSPQ